MISSLPLRRERPRGAGWRRSLTAALLIAAPWSVHAIDAPQPAAPPSAPAEAQRAPTSPSDQRDFYRRLQRAQHTQTLRGLDVDDAVIDALAQGAAAQAISSLSADAAQGDAKANIALVRLQHWCNRILSSRLPTPEQQIAKLPESLQGERAAKAAGVIVAQTEYRQRAGAACRQARFDYGRIEAQLREAADAGDPASAVELAQFLRDPKEREAMLQAAMSKGYAPALYAAATQLLMAVQRGQTTENVSSIRLYLKQAGPTIPRAKLDLANCMALGCDGHPADSATARAFGLDAARDGEPTAYLSMLRMPWGRGVSRTDHLAWQHFGDRLNEAGCFGDAYIPSAATFAQSIAMLEQNQDENALSAARTRADELWKMHSERAMQEQGCAYKGSSD